MKRIFLLIFACLLIFGYVHSSVSAQTATPSPSPTITPTPTPVIPFQDVITFDGTKECLRSMMTFDRKLSRIKPGHSLLENYNPDTCQRIMQMEFDSAMELECNDFVWDGDNAANNARLRAYFEPRFSSIPDSGGVCAIANPDGVGTVEGYRQVVQIGTEAQLNAIVNSLQCGFELDDINRIEELNNIESRENVNLSTIEPAHFCCKQENFDVLDTNIFSAVPHECLLLGELCVDELTNLFLGDTINDTVADKSQQLADVMDEIHTQKPPCITGSAVQLSPTTCVCLKEDAELCTKYILDTSSQEFAQCKSCLQKNRDRDENGNPVHLNMYTAFGCIDARPQGLINFVFSVGIGIAGGVSLIGIIYSSFLLQTSGGKPETIERARELLTSFITGLIVIIFSIFILRFISVDLLRIPGFLE